MKFIEHNLVFTGPLQERHITKYCIFHHVGGGWNTVEEIHEGQIAEHKWLGIAYHAIVYPDGSAHIGRPFDMCDASCFGHNDDSFSICFIGDFNIYGMTPAQIETGIELMRWVCEKYPGIMGIRHRDLSDTTCPGRSFADRIIMEGMMRVEKPKVNLTWQQILEKVSNSPKKWDAGITTAVGLAKYDSNLGDLEIFKFLPELIEKIYYSRS